jgi:NADPH:quinone reductase-like Zn-dependent oxidoreductase
MNSWILPAYGAPDIIRRDAVPEPTPGPDDVLIRVEAASVNPLDNKLISGDLKDNFPVKFPYALGTDASGTIVRVGESVRALKAGDRAFVRNAGGAFSDLLCVPAKGVARLPDTVSFADGAALPTVAGTAWEAIMEKGGLRAGQTVLIHAGSGGVGHFAVQFAKLAGAHVVATTSAQNLHLVSDLGADEVLDYQAGDFRAKLSDVDVVLDPMGGVTQTRSFDVMRQGGVLVSLVAPPDEKLAAGRGVRAMLMSYQSDAGRLERIAALVADGKVSVLIDQRYGFARVPDALARVASGRVNGKVVVTG